MLERKLLPEIKRASIKKFIQASSATREDGLANTK
jgi:hypothetical protein